MGVTITAVPAAASADPPAPPSMTERALLDFVASLENSPMSGMPNLANPAALAGEIFGNLRGFFEKAEKYQYQKGLIAQSPGADRAGAGVMLASMDGEPRTDLGRDTALGGLEPADATDGVLPRSGISIAELQRTMELALQVVNFTVEANLVTHAAAQIPHSVGTLLKGT